MKVLHLFSGGLGGVLADYLLGHTPVALCEIETAPRELAAKRLPGVPCFPDVTTLTGDMVRESVGEIDIIAGGSPCQDVSCAGKGKGFAEGARSSLIWHQVRLTSELRPRFMFWENVQGAVSAAHRPQFDAFLFELEQLGYGGAWCILSAAQAGAPHQRKRVWLLAERDRPGGFREASTKHLPAWPHPAAGFVWPTPTVGVDQGGFKIAMAQVVDAALPGSVYRKSGHKATLALSTAAAGCELAASVTWPTPDASSSNSGESVVTWEARRERIAAEGKNGNGMGTPLSIATQQGELWATARVSGAGTEDFVRDDGKLRDDLQTMVVMAECVSPSPSAWPTVKASDAGHSGPNQRDSRGNLALTGAVAHEEAAIEALATARPSPRAMKTTYDCPKAFVERQERGDVSTPGLCTAAAMEEVAAIPSVSARPTPTVQDGENAAGPSQFVRNTLPLNAEVFRDLVRNMTPEQVRAIIRDRRLNPDWVENLMGWPVGFTDLTCAKPRVPTAANGAYIFPAGRWVPQKPHEPARITSVKPRSPEAKARNARLKMLGNGQVPQCAAMAYRFLFSALPRIEIKPQH